MVSKEPRHVRFVWAGKSFKPQAVVSAGGEMDSRRRIQPPLQIPRPTYSLERRPSIDSGALAHMRKKVPSATVPTASNNVSAHAHLEPSNSLKHSHVVKPSHVVIEHMAKKITVPSATRSVQPSSEIRSILKSSTNKQYQPPKDNSDSSLSADDKQAKTESKFCYRLQENSDENQLRKSVSFKDDVLISRVGTRRQFSPAFSMSNGVHTSNGSERKQVFV